MRLKTLLFALITTLAAITAMAQNKPLSIENVYKIYLQNSGPIMDKNQVKGYYLFYQSDKVDKHTNEYTLQILDQNLNKVKDVKFNDDKNVDLLEAAFNGGSLIFLFHNSKEKLLVSKVFDLNGQLKFSYEKELDKKSENFIETYEKQHTDDYTNQQIFSLDDKGFALVIPLRDGRLQTYEVNYYGSDTKKSWTYDSEGDDRFTIATYLGNTDSVIVLEVLKKEHLLSSKVTSTIVGLNFATHKKVFEIDDSQDTYKFVPQNSVKLANTGNVMLMGSYYDKTSNILTDFSLGLAIYIVNPEGKVLSKSYNSWAGDIGKFLPMNEKGKIDDIGFLFFHNIIQTADGNIFAVGEGYKRTADALGIGLNVLSAMGGRVNGGGNTMIKITNMVILKFGPGFKITGASIQEKNPNKIHTMLADLNSQHLLALYLKSVGAFDYAFTTTNNDASSFSVYYDDYEREKNFHGETFHALRYNGTKFLNDRLELTSEASRLRVLPAKQGFVMVMEYFRKDKRLNIRLEKMN